MLGKLIAIRLRALFTAAGAKTKNGQKVFSPGRVVLICVLYAFLALCFGGMSFSFGLGIAAVTIEQNVPWLYFTLFFLAAFTVVFIFSIFETKSELFDCKDNDLLLSLPIAPGDIVLARTLTVLLLNYAESAILILPAIAAFLLMGGSPAVIVGGLVCLLTLPLGATALSCVFGYLIAVLAKRVKRKNIFQLFFTLLFLGAYFFVYTVFLERVEALVSGEVDLSVLGAKLAFLKFLGDAGLSRPLPLVILAVCLIVIGAASFLLIRRSYIRIVTDARGRAKTVYKKEQLRASSPLRALTRKEFARFTSSATYMVNGGFGFLLILVAAVLALVKSSTVRELLESEVLAEIGLSVDASVLAPLYLGLLSWLVMMTFMSVCTVSLEGKSLWIIRTLPVSARTVLLAKMLPHLILSAAFCVPSGILLAAASGAAWYWYPAFVFIPLIASLFSASYGICLGCAFPRFDFISEAHAVKQSTAVMVASLSLMFGGMILFGAYSAVLLFLGKLAAVLSLVLFFGGLAALCTALVFGPCARKFDTFTD